MKNSGFRDVTAQAFTTSSTKTETIPMVNASMVSLLINKTGAGKGTVKLQGSNDEITWKDLNTTICPDSTSLVGAGTASASISAFNVAYLSVRYSFTEDGTGIGNITGGKWNLK